MLRVFFCFRWANTSFHVCHAWTSIKRYVSYCIDTVRIVTNTQLSLVSCSVVSWRWWDNTPVPSTLHPCLLSKLLFLACRSTDAQGKVLQQATVRTLMRYMIRIVAVRFVPPNCDIPTFPSQKLPTLLTELEISMPLNWCTTVMHLFMCVTVSTMEDCGTHSLFLLIMLASRYESYLSNTNRIVFASRTGPFSSANMLDVERFQTVFKGLARGTRNIMLSIRNHYQILEASLNNRMVRTIQFSEYVSYCGDTVRTFPPSLLQTRNMSWTRKARVSTSAGFAARRDVFDKSDRLTEPKGSATSATLSPDDLKQVQEIWGEQVPGYGGFLQRFARRMQRKTPAERVDNVNDWSSRQHSPAELQWQTMTSDIEVLIVLLRYDSYPTRMLTYSRCSTKSSMLETHSRPRSSKITSTQRRTTPTSDTTTWMNKATRLPSTAPSFVYFGTQCMKTVRFVSPKYDSYCHSTFRIPIVPPL